MPITVSSGNSSSQNKKSGNNVNDNFQPIKVPSLSDFLIKYPNTIVNNKVVNNALKDNKNLPNDFRLPDSVIEIGNGAFDGAIIPKNFHLPTSLTILGENSFKNFFIDTSFSFLTSLKPLAKVYFLLHFTKWFWFTVVNKSNWWLCFCGTKLPDGFSILGSVSLIGNYTFQNASLPTGFSIPKQ